MVGNIADGLAHTGFVRWISVRATEIETFDRGSVIVPNSELLSHTVLKWTHQDSLERVLIPISVAVRTDVLKAQKLLFECAANHKECLRNPSRKFCFTVLETIRSISRCAYLCGTTFS